MTARIGMFCLLLAVASCAKDDQSSDDSTAVENSSTVVANEVPIDSAEQQNVPAASDLDAQTSVFDPQTTTSSDLPETATAPQSPDAQTINAENIVEQFDFSAVDDLATKLTPATSELYCLDGTTQNDIDMEQACTRISDRLASVSMQSCRAAKLTYTNCNSVNGFPILIREFPPLSMREPQGRILVVGGTHGDELTSISVTFRWIEKLNQYHSGLFHWHVVPMMNPDGVLNSSASRTNHNGVDLNRNMPSEDWHANALKYWREKKGENPRRYPGEHPASEPEVQWLIDEINAFKPDAIISVHAPYGVVDFDALLLSTAPKNLGKLHLNLLGTYPGSLGNYAGINRNIPVITLELPHSWVMPSEAETTKIWEDIVSWLRKNVPVEQGNKTEVAQNTDESSEAASTPAKAN